MPWTLTLERDELEQVTDLLAPCPPLETNSDGIWVRHQGGLRIWECESWPVTWQLHGARTTTELAPRCLPGRLVYHAAELATRSVDGTVTVSIPDERVALAECDAGTVVIDLPNPDHKPHLPRFVTGSATVTTTVGDLRDLLTRARARPIGMDPDVRPLTAVSARPGTLQASLDWSRGGGLRSTHRIPATVNGEAESYVSAEAVLDLLKYQERDEDVTITFPADRTVPLLLDGHAFHASVARPETGVGRYVDEVGQALADLSGAPCRVVDGGFRVRFADAEFRVTLHETPSEIVEITSVVCTDVAATTELLLQINALNRRPGTTRFWLDDDRVHAATEVPCDALESLHDRLTDLHASLEGVAVFLGALGADDEI